MTIIDTATYCNGELRLSCHGVGKGGTVLVHEPSGEQLDVHPETEIAVIDMLQKAAPWWSSDYLFSKIETYHDGFLNSYRS